MRVVLYFVVSVFFLSGCSVDSSCGGVSVKWILDSNKNTTEDCNNTSINQKIIDSQMKPYDDAKKRGDL